MASSDRPHNVHLPSSQLGGLRLAAELHGAEPQRLEHQEDHRAQPEAHGDWALLPIAIKRAGAREAKGRGRAVAQVGRWPGRAAATMLMGMRLR